MSYAPTTLLQARTYLLDTLDAHPGVTVDADLDPGEVGIVGNTKTHFRGYHLGKDRIFSSSGKGWNDYSVKHARDRAGLSNGASALDVGEFDQVVDGRRLTLVGLTAWAVAEARAGRRPDTREIIGPGANGRAYRWAAENGWRAELRAAGDSHEWHMHESWYRDSEHRDKIKYYRPYVEGDDMALDDKIQIEGTARDWMYKRYGLKAVTLGGAVASGYGRARLANEQNADIIALLTALAADKVGCSVEDLEALLRQEHERAAELERAERQAEHASLIGQLQAGLGGEAGAAAARVLADIIARGALPQD